jgi:uncharacterized NAD(P)/FAD-binding protein YdhS
MGDRVRVAVIGGGFSGLLVALRLLLERRDLEVTLIERGPRFARGAAYSTSSPHHLLNVRASNMSAFADQPGHFLAWLAAEEGESGATEANGERFVTRDRYGRYLQSLLRAAARGDAAQRLMLENDEVVRLARDGEGWRLHLAMGRLISADVVVLAPGNLPPPMPCAIDERLIRSRRFARDPWAWDPAETPVNGDILLLGSGLTAIDITISILERRPDARILSLSRHGLTPRRHAETSVAPAAGFSPNGSPLAALRQVRALAADDWRAAVDAARAHARSFWQGWSLEEKRAFLRHLRPWWDIHRHRLAPTVAARIDDLRTDGTYLTTAGRLRWLRPAPGGLDAAWIPRHGTELVERRFALAVNCSGPSGDLAGSDDPLIRDMLGAGLVRPDACRLGIDVDTRARAISRDGAPIATLFAVGPITRGQFYEITSVPDIRVQAADCAREIARLSIPPRRRVMAISHAQAPDAT